MKIDTSIPASEATRFVWKTRATLSDLFQGRDEQRDIAIETLHNEVKTAMNAAFSAGVEYGRRNPEPEPEDDQ